MEAKQQYISEQYERPGDNVDSLNLRLNPEYLLEKIRRRLLKYTHYNVNTGQFERNGQALPLFHEDGIDEYMTILESIIHIPAVLGNLDQNKANNSCRNVTLSARNLIIYKHYMYGISESNWQMLLGMVMNNAEIFLSRPLSGRENELLTLGNTRRETVTNNKQVTDESSQQGGGGLFAMGMLRGRR